MEKTPLNLFKQKHMMSREIPASPFMKKLGYGTGICVYLLPNKLKRNQTASPWAVKKTLKLKHDTTMYGKRLDFEAEVLRRLTHRNIVEFKAYEMSQDGRFNLCMEACSMSLGDLLEKRYEDKLGPLEVFKINTLGLDISKALNYLHNEVLMMHGDMKSFNILIKGNFGICKLCDFGVSLKVKKDGLLDFDKDPKAHYVGTDLWSAPEIFEEDSTLISTKSEIFSFGLVFYECLTCVPPNTLEMMDKKALDFDDVACEEIEEIEDEEDEGPIYGIRPPFPEDMKLSEDYNDILHIFNICTDDDPEQRPDARKLENIFNELNIIVID
ncbi:unnamed protein product [Chironomus riparius]|uniref:mitogen-activated protein kinase kinase n=1 Tax=Chironomus riparius TaxID=315576 RepID=A0A9N9S5I1_9DIPT|nr:unnamed protein product [Chironomus riparius]